VLILLPTGVGFGVSWLAAAQMKTWEQRSEVDSIVPPGMEEGELLMPIHWYRSAEYSEK